MAQYTYNYTGGVQTYTPSAGIGKITINAYGAQGGSCEGGQNGGYGGQVIGTFAVSPGTTYYISVGQGGSWNTNTSINSPYGVYYNQSYGGGGYGSALAMVPTVSSYGSGGGGGMTWFSPHSTFDASVLLVAGGGGGGCAGGGDGGGVGGNTTGGGGGGGGGSGRNGSPGGGGNPGSGGSGGAGGVSNGGSGTSGSFGQGGNSGAYYTAGGTGSPGGGGGGGYYGGGGGGGSGYNSGDGVGGGGGGGSSFTAGSITNVTMNAGVNGTGSAPNVAPNDGSLTITEISLNISVSDTEIITEWQDILWNKTRNPKVSDVESITEAVSLHRVPFSASTNASVTTSNYKWETSTLLKAQGQYGVQPYLKCSVVDESLLPNSQLFNNQSSSVWSGDSTTAPDGSILAVGYNSVNGNLTFAKIPDGTQISQWNSIINGTGITIIANGSWTPYNPNFGAYTGFHINASISVSDWRAGTYVIDIYYWYNDGTYFQVKRARSVDGGASFITYSDLQTTLIANTSLQRFQVAAGKPVYIPATGNVSATVFMLTGNIGGGGSSNVIAYSYTANGSTFGGSTWQQWSTSSPVWAGAPDFMLHSFDVEYVNGVYYVIFSGYHSYIESTNTFSILPLASTTTQNNFFGNFGLYIMKVFQMGDVGVGIQQGTGVIWDDPIEILQFESNASTNYNQALYPAVFYDGTYLWLTFRGDLAISVSETTQVTTSTNYYLCRSADFKNFEYPLMITDSNGNTISNPSPTGTYTNGICRYTFIGNQNGYYYIWGDGALWQYVQNNIVADISADIIGFQITDQSGGASSVNITLANQSGKWAGPNPSGVNYQAIWKNGVANKNSHIYLQLGYYNSSGVGETIPRNIFYIDDITQSNSAKQNDLVLSGRDWNKLLSTTQSAFTYNFLGPDFYNDGFTSVTTPNWNVTSGQMLQAIQTTTGPLGNTLYLNTFAPYTTYQVYNSSVPTNGTFTLNGATFASLSGFQVRKSQMTMSVVAYLPPSTQTGAEVDFYPFYVSQNNYIQIALTANGANTIMTITQVYNSYSQAITVTNNTFNVSSAAWYPIYIRMGGYGQNLDVQVGQPGTAGNDIFNFLDPIAYFSGQTTFAGGPYNASLNGQLPTIAFGTNGNFGTQSAGPGVTPQVFMSFSNLRFVQYTHSQNLEELTKKLAIKAHVFNYITEKDLVQDLYDYSQWNTSGGFTLNNREINLTSQNFILQNTTQYGDGQIDFDAKVSASAGESFGFDFILRAQDATDLVNCYKIRVMNSSNFGSGYLMKVSLVETANLTGNTYTDYPLFSSVIPDTLPYRSYSGQNNLNIDITQWNHYTIGFNKGWIYVFINELMVFAWYDNNYYSNFLSGYWGFSTVCDGTHYDDAFGSDEILQVKNIKFPTFWQQNDAFNLNPGDDLTSAINQNLQTTFGWFFSDLGGRFKLVILKSNDSVSYYYGNGTTNYLLYNSSTDNSDKEYFNQVLVIGNGVSYLATNGSSVGANGVLRDEVIVDYTVTTVSGAQARANQELANIAKFGSQPSPQTNLNPGSEVFDVVNIQDNNGVNSTNLNGNYRVFTQTSLGDSKSNYNVTLGTGKLS